MRDIAVSIRLQASMRPRMTRPPLQDASRLASKSTLSTGGILLDDSAAFERSSAVATGAAGAHRQMRGVGPRRRSTRADAIMETTKTINASNGHGPATSAPCAIPAVAAARPADIPRTREAPRLPRAKTSQKSPRNTTSRIAASTHCTSGSLNQCTHHAVEMAFLDELGRRDRHARRSAVSRRRRRSSGRCSMSRAAPPQTSHSTSSRTTGSSGRSHTRRAQIRAPPAATSFPDR
jgi:hypothetical protein